MLATAASDRARLLPSRSRALVLPLLAPNDYVIGVAARICLYATLALGLNVVVGFAGLLDIGYVAFFGIGSYLYAFMASPHFGLHLPFLLALPLVVLGTALFGILIGAPTLRLGGDYLAIVTLGFGEITYLLLLNLDRPINITNGPSGIIDIDPPALLGHVMTGNTRYYYLFLVVLALALAASNRLQHSRIGWAWQAIREDELAARAMGINTTVAKLQAFAIGASFAGFAGRAACLLATLGVPRELPVHRVDQRARHGDHRRHGQPGGRGPRRRRDRRPAGGLPRAAGLPAPGVRPHAHGADDLPAPGDPGAACRVYP